MRNNSRIDVTGNITNSYLACSCGHKIPYRDIVYSVIIDDRSNRIECPSCGKIYFCTQEIRVYEDKYVSGDRMK